MYSIINKEECRIDNNKESIIGHDLSNMKVLGVLPPFLQNVWYGYL